MCSSSHSAPKTQPLPPPPALPAQGQAAPVINAGDGGADLHSQLAAAFGMQALQIPFKGLGNVGFNNAPGIFRGNSFMSGRTIVPNSRLSNHATLSSYSSDTGVESTTYLGVNLGHGRTNVNTTAQAKVAPPK